MDAIAKEKLQARLKKLSNKGFFDNKKVYLFGGSRHLRGMREALQQLGIPISGVIDKDSRKSGTDYMGIPISPPEETLAQFDKNIVVLILSNRYYREMVTQLKSWGYVSGKNYVVLNDVVGTRNDESLKCFFKMAFRAVRGLKDYRKLIGDEKKTLFLAPYPGAGDMYLISLFFHQYLEKHSIQDYIMVVRSNSCKKIAQMAGIKHVEIRTANQISDIARGKSFFRTDWDVVVLADGWNSEIMRWLKGYKGLNLEQVFRHLIFGLDDSVPHRLLPVKDQTREISVLFEQYGLQPGKTVVLSPYANTIYEHHEKLWFDIVQICKERGYSVCTNCGTPGETAIEGTIPVFFPFSQAVAFMNAAGYFVGIRSGLCDIISTSSCKKVIIYEAGGVAYASSVFEYFSLNKMGLCNDAIELEYCIEKTVCEVIRIVQQMD